MSKFFPVIAAIIVVIAGPAGAAAQLITPAPVPPTQYLQKRAFDSSWAAANQKCWSTGAPCQYPDFFGACQAEWKGLDYLWCLCTTGYYEALHTCSACEVSVGIASADVLSTEISMDSENCLRQTSLMRNKSPGLLLGKSPKPTGTSVEGQDSTASTTESTDSWDVTPPEPTSDMAEELIGPLAGNATTTANPSEAPGETAAPNSAAPERLVGFLGLVGAGFVAAIAVM